MEEVRCAYVHPWGRFIDVGIREKKLRLDITFIYLDMKSEEFLSHLVIPSNARVPNDESRSLPRIQALLPQDVNSDTVVDEKED